MVRCLRLIVGCLKTPTQLQLCKLHCMFEWLQNYSKRLNFLLALQYCYKLKSNRETFKTHSLVHISHEFFHKWI